MGSELVVVPRLPVAIDIPALLFPIQPFEETWCTFDIVGKTWLNESVVSEKTLDLW